MNYLVILIFSLVLILQLLRIVKEIFNPKIMSHKIFNFPERKTAKIGYYLCAAMLLLLVILNRLDKMGLNFL